MECKSDLKKDLRTAKMCKQNFLFELSYEKVKDLNYLTREEILRYINDNYINDKEFKKEDLINDLIAFKTYKDYVEEIVAKDDILEKLFSVFINVLSIFTAFKIGMLQIQSQMISGKAVEDDFSIIEILLQKRLLPLNILVLGSLVIYFSIFLIRYGNKSESSKLKTLNNAIYILEAIKEDMVEVPEIKKFDIEVDSIGNKVSEPRKYSFKVKESLEDNSK